MTYTTAQLIASSLESVLEKQRIIPQSYFSSAFVGNHCNKYLQTHVSTDLIDNIVKQTQACTNNPAALAKAKHTKQVFDSLNRAFASVRSGISDIKHICKTDIPAIQNQINTYMTLFRQLFSGGTIPTKHILENQIINSIHKDHIVWPWASWCTRHRNVSPDHQDPQKKSSRHKEQAKKDEDHNEQPTATS